MDGRPPRRVRKVPARHADHSRNNSSGGAACRGTERFCGRAGIETIVAETGPIGEKRALDGLWPGDTTRTAGPDRRTPPAHYLVFRERHE